MFNFALLEDEEKQRQAGLTPIPSAPDPVPAPPAPDGSMPPPAPPAPAIDPRVAAYVMAQKQPQNPFTPGQAAATGLAGLGDAMKGAAGQTGNAAKTVMDNALEAPKQAFERAQLGHQASTQAEQDDPESSISKAQRSFLTKLGIDPAKIEKLSYAQMQPMATLAEKTYGIDATTKERLMAAQIAADARRDVAASTKGLRDFTIGQKDEQFWQKQWTDLLNKNNPNSANSRSAIGMLGRANVQANRAKATLSNPMVTNQEAGNVMADIAGIYQGGAPSEFGMSHQQYTTLYGKVQGILQSLTGTPQDALPADVKARLLKTLDEMQGVNTTIIKDQLNTVEKTQKKVISRYPDEWKDFRAQLEGGNTPAPGAQAKVVEVKSEADALALPPGTRFSLNGRMGTAQ